MTLITSRNKEGARATAPPNQDSSPDNPAIWIVRFTSHKLLHRKSLFVILSGINLGKELHEQCIPQWVQFMPHFLFTQHICYLMRIQKWMGTIFDFKELGDKRYKGEDRHPLSIPTFLGEDIEAMKSMNIPWGTGRTSLIPGPVLYYIF